MKRPMLLIGAGLVCIGIGPSSARPAPAGAAEGPPAGAVTAFRDVRVFDGDTVIERTTVLVRDGEIAAIGAGAAIPAGAAVVDGAGRTLMPGLIDAQTAAPAPGGLISDFDGPDVTASFGMGWHVSTDAMMGGSSQARMQLVKPGAGGAGGALDVSGTIVAGAPAIWAGAMFFPGDTPMAPVSLSRFKELVFKAKGNGREHLVMLFASRLGQQPALRTFRADAEWQEHVIPFTAFAAQLDGSDISGLLFSGGPDAGAFSFQIDDVGLR